jgi:hypothetical protein
MNETCISPLQTAVTAFVKQQPFTLTLKPILQDGFDFVHASAKIQLPAKNFYSRAHLQHEVRTPGTKPLTAKKLRVMSLAL